MFQSLHVRTIKQISLHFLKLSGSITGYGNEHVPVTLKGYRALLVRH